MRGLKKRRRVQLIALSAVCLTLAVAMIGYAMQDGISYFRSPTQVFEDPPEAGERFRIGGLVEVGSLVRGSGSEIRFRTTDGATSVETRYLGLLPDLFAEGQGVVALGRMEDGVFIATEILAKHDENYMPREVVEALKEQGVYKPAAAN